MSKTAQGNDYQWILRLIFAALVWFGLGVILSSLLGMGWIDRVAFLACLGVVFVIGAAMWMAWHDAGRRRDEP